MPSFQEIGLREELLQALEDEEIITPTAFQEAVIPAIRRGGNLVARVSSGSGKTLAFGLGILDRLEADEGEEDDEGDRADESRPLLRALVLTPTPEDARNVGVALTPYAHAVGLRTSVIGAGWGTPAAEAMVLTVAAGDVMDAVRSSDLKLDGVEAVVVDGASTIVELGQWEQVDALMDLLPRAAQRIVLSPALGEEVEDLVARRVKRALRYPSEPAVPEGSAAPLEGGVGYVIASEGEKLELISAQLHGREPGTAPPILFCRSDERAADLAERLSVRGFLVGDPGEAEADVAIATAGATLAEIGEATDGGVGQSISFDVPADAESLRARHAGDEHAIVLIEPRELAHLREIARLARFRARSTPLNAPASTMLAELKGFRDEVRESVRHDDLAAQMLVLEPLFDEFTAHEVAAALATMVRRRRPAASPEPAQVAASPAAAARPEKGTSPGPAPVTWARLFVSLGSRDDVRPGDLVGALAGEANVPGSRIGKIEIRDTFSIVEVQSDVADQIIRAVNGTTLKGRSVRVDYDRGGPARRPDTRTGPTRRTTRRPPS